MGSIPARRTSLRRFRLAVLADGYGLACQPSLPFPSRWARGRLRLAGHLPPLVTRCHIVPNPSNSCGSQQRFKWSQFSAASAAFTPHLAGLIHAAGMVTGRPVFWPQNLEQGVQPLVDMFEIFAQFTAAIGAVSLKTRHGQSPIQLRCLGTPCPRLVSARRRRPPGCPWVSAWSSFLTVCCGPAHCMDVRRFRPDRWVSSRSEYTLPPAR